ncbi:MAG: hypothetical protein WC510_07490 [Candidatus Omnitrophota bacterium]
MQISLLKDKIHIKDIPLSQRKIILIAVIAVAVFLFFLLAVYTPVKRHVSALKKEAHALENQANRVRLILDNAKTADAGVRLLEDRYRKLNSKFSGRSSDSLKIIFDLAKRMNIEVVSLNTQLKTEFFDADNLRIEIEGRACQVNLVSIEMKCFYRDLVKYIEILNKTLPSFVMIEKIKITKENPKNTRLYVKIDLNLYSSS